MFKWIPLYFLMFTVSLHALASERPYSAWQVDDEIDLPLSFKNDKNINMLFVDDMLLIGSPRLQQPGCGSVNLYAQAANGNYRVTQRLSAVDLVCHAMAVIMASVFPWLLMMKHW